MGIPVEIVSESTDWPAWVQAVGSVSALVALFVAQRLDHSAARKLRTEDARDRNQRIAQASVTAAKFVTASIASARNTQAEVEQTGWITNIFQLHRVDLEAALNALREIDPGTLPDEQAVVAVVNLLQAGHVADLLIGNILADIAAGRAPNERPFDAIVAGAERSLAQLRERWQVAGVSFG